MTPERWKRINQLLDSALQREAKKRQAFLKDACAGDEELRKEVESLLADREQAGRFVSVPAFDLRAKGTAEGRRDSLPGQEIGAYSPKSSRAGSAGMD